MSSGAIGAGLLPIAVGYLVAHYLTYLLVDGQRIVIAVSDPLQQGQDLFGTAFFCRGRVPATGLVWTVAARRGRRRPHARRMGGHVRAQRDMEASPSRPTRDMRHRKLQARAATATCGCARCRSRS